MSKQGGLGRGLESLIPTQIVESEFDVQARQSPSGDQILQVKPSLIDPNPHQPRQSFDSGQLAELAGSIKLHGILQPLVVTESGDRYQLIAGERRLRASKQAGLATVPVIVRSFDEQQKLELALIENLQRADLNAIETATAYRKLIDQFNLSVDDLAKRVGKERPTVSNTMRLLNLPIEAKRAIAAGQLTEGTARVILTLADSTQQAELLKLILQNNWTTRQAEEYARGLREGGGSHEQAKERISRTNELTNRLGNYLNTKVTQVTTAKGGRLIIEYRSDAQLDEIAKIIQSSETL